MSACAPDQSHDSERAHALARSRLPDDAERLAGLTENETPSTAFTTPSSVGKWTLRSLTSRSGSGTYAYLTRGSRAAYTISTTRFATTMKTAPITVTPMTMGKSSVPIE